MRNINLPKRRVYIRCDAFGGSIEEFEPAWIVSVRSIRYKPLCFQVWVDRYAACYDKVPPHCIYWKLPTKGHKHLPLNKVQMWENLSGSIECWIKAQLVDVPMVVNLGAGYGTCKGTYWCTIDFLPEREGGGYLDVGETHVLEEHKEANIICLENGQIAIYPNNRLKWLPPSLTSTDSITAIPPWHVATNEQWDSWWLGSSEMLGDAQWAY